MSLFQSTCAYGGNMIIIKPRFLNRRLGRQLLAAILGTPLCEWPVNSPHGNSSDTDSQPSHFQAQKHI
jgi:hypothetical protein